MSRECQNTKNPCKSNILFRPAGSEYVVLQRFPTLLTQDELFPIRAWNTDRLFLK